MVSELFSTAMMATSVDPEIYIRGEELAHRVGVSSIPPSVQIHEKGAQLGFYVAGLHPRLSMGRRSDEEPAKEYREQRSSH
jgi:hypothetical protein